MQQQSDSSSSESDAPRRRPLPNQQQYFQTRLQRFFTRLSTVSGIRFQRNSHSVSSGTRTNVDVATSRPLQSSDMGPTHSQQILDCTQGVDDMVHASEEVQDIHPNQSGIVSRSNEAWGDPIFQSKPPKACRIFFQNVHGLRPTHRIEGKWVSSLQVMSYYDVDIFGFTETCLNWSNRRLASQYKDEARHCFRNVSINHSINSYHSESDYLPGGALQATVGSWTGRIKRALHDPHKMGRWTGMQYSIQESQSLYIITMYRVGKSEQLGLISSYTQQTLALQQRFGMNTHKTPRLQVLLDLQDYLTSLSIKPTDHVIIMTDANETLGEDPYGLTELMSKHRLVDLFTRHHQRDCEVASYKLSENRRIDFIIGTAGILPYIQNCGYLPFDKGIESDHRGLFIDLDQSIAKGHIHIKSPPQRKIGYSTSKKEVRQYKEYIVDQFKRFNIIQRAKNLYEQASEEHEDQAAFLEELNNVDQTITSIVLESEQTQCTKKPPINWTPEIQNASLLIKYWKLKYNARTHPYDITDQLQIIYDQLTPDRQTTIDIASGSHRTNLRKAKLAKMELYKLHRDHMAAATDKRMTADALFLGIDKDVVENRYKHRMTEDRMFQYLKTIYPKNRGMGITHIEVPDRDCHGQSTNEPSKAASWRTINDPEEMTERLIQRNISHFGQAANSPFATYPLQEIFGYDGTNDNAQRLVRNGMYPESLNENTINESTQHILKRLSSAGRLPPFSDSISSHEFWKAFKIWDEQTSTSPSGRHLGHYKSLLISDGADTQYDDENPNPSEIIKQVYYHVAMAAVYTGNTLDRWCNSSTMMLEKDPGQPRIHRLRVIHLYEADYNLLLKILWARRLVWHSHKHGGLHEAQAGSRPDHRCSDVVIRKELNYLYAKLTRTALATVDNDAKACYDRIICNLAMLISQFFGMSNRACKVHSKTLRKMKFRIRTGGGDSRTTYQHTDATPVHGSGQGSCASPSLWLHISTVLLGLLDDIAQGMTCHDVVKNLQRRISAEGFVDDIALFINHILLTEDNLTHLYAFIHQDINLWQQLLASSGGKLELQKCFYYVLSWKFNKYGDPIPKTLEELHQEVAGRVQIIDPDTTQAITMTQKDVSDTHKTLGVYKSIEGMEVEQKKALLAKSNKLATQTKLGHLTRYQARRAYTAIYMPSMTYSLVGTSLSESDLHEIQSKALFAFLPAMGFEPTYPRAVVHGPRMFGGLNLGHLYTEMHVAKVGALLAHIQVQSGLGDIMLKNINWLQLHSGLSKSVLQGHHQIQYVPDNWFLHLKRFLYSIRGSLVIPSQWLPQLERVHDVTLMDVVMQKADDVTKAECRIFNNWRIYFQVTTLADITYPDGQKIQLCYWLPPGDGHGQTTSRKSRHNWPRQEQPHVSTFRIWRKLLKKACNIRSNGELHQPLGDWTRTSKDSYNDWNEYIDPRTKMVYKRQHDGSFWMYVLEREGNQRSTYSATPEEIIQQIPDTCIPTQTEWSSNNQAQTVIHKNFMGPIQRRPSPCRNFDEHLDHLPQWRSDLLIHWTTKPIEELVRLFNCSPLLRIASDGSYHKESAYGAFGAVVGNDTDILMQIRGHAPGTNELKSSFRSELYGLLAVSVLVTEVTQYCRLTDPQRHTLQFHLDSKSVIDRVQYHRCHAMTLGAMVAADVDLELQILEEFKTLECLGYKVPPLQHVKAHQDQHISYDLLSREAQLNVEADALAASMMTNQYYNIPYTMFPTTNIQLTINDNIITSKYKECLRTAYLTQDLNEYYQKKFAWDTEVSEEIWWDVFGSAIKCLSHSDRQKIQKFHIRRLHTNTRKHMFQSSTANTCQFCDNEEETNDHLLQCQQCSEHRIQLREAWLTDLYNFLDENHTSEQVRTAIMAAITCWLNGDQIPPLASIVPEASSILQKAYLSQTHIGWDNFFRGKLSIYWEECVAHILTREKVSSKVMTSDRWAVTLISKLWAGVLSLWEARNREVYGSDQTTQQCIMKTALLKEAKHILQEGETYQILFLPWFQKTIEELEHYNVLGLKAWIRNARTVVRLYHQEQRSKNRDEDDLRVVEPIVEDISRRMTQRRRRIPMDLQVETIPRGT